MKDFLILKLQGAMQAWGEHTFEDFRPSYVFPTRSSVVGLLGACLGIDREEISKREDLNNSFELTIISTKRKIKKNSYNKEVINYLPIRKITDFHTVLDGRKADGKARKEAIISHREYLCDAEFTLILDFKENAVYKVNDIKKAIDDPVFTPFLGRRSCPLHRPLFDKIVTAENIQQALEQLSESGVIYSENKEVGGFPMQIRDVPVNSKVRQFINRTIYIFGENNVS
ncbi:MAG: type I-E CRISPR-associated protein Cas5/CasD [Bdellovibrionales bacterium]|nr:type I-E CRISPR-associated protein Cas5/CasD [Bdellovibrionales bacterium]